MNDGIENGDVIVMNDNGFKIGCGRYVQEYGLLEQAAREIGRFGKRPYIIGGKNGLAAAGDRIKASLDKAGTEYYINTYTAPCNRENAVAITQSAEFDGCDVVVGVGGGRIMDMSKLTAHYAGLPTVNIPTSSATCAAFTPISICYSAEGKTEGSEKFETEISCVLCDMDVMEKQPVRLIVSGAYDAMAKIIESEQRKYLLDEDIGFRCSFELSELIYTRLLEKLPCVTEYNKNGRVGDEAEYKRALYEVVYLSVAGAGAVSGFARGSNQCAVGHKFYEKTRILFPVESAPYYHGELVAMGLIAQLYYNGCPNRAEEFRKGMKRAGLAVSLGECGIPCGAEVLSEYYELICDSSAMKGADAEDKKRLLAALGEIVR